MSFVVAVLSMIGLAACGAQSAQSDDGPDFDCGFGHSDLQIDVNINNCPECSFAKAWAVADGTFTHAAPMKLVDSANANITIRVTVGNDLTFQSGKQVGFFWRQTPPASLCDEIRTYLDGQLQETIGSGCVGGTGDGGASAASTRKAFDAVEVQLTGQGDFGIEEICADIGALAE